MTNAYRMTMAMILVLSTGLCAESSANWPER